jgi:inner membrane protein
MMALTHMAIAAAGVSFALGRTDPTILALAALGSQLPDLDSTESWIGQICFPVSRWLQSRYPHRTLTHSLVATAAIAVITGPLYFGFGWPVWGALWLAHLITIFSDTFTKKGVQLFFPAPVWCVCGINPNKRLTTGGPGEYWVLCAAVALLCLNLYLTHSGGLLTKAGQTLGIKEGALQTYNEQAARHQIYAQVEGVWASDRTSATGRYPVIAAEGSEFVVLTPQGLVKTGQQIITSKVTTEVGQPATTQIRTLTLSDQDPLEQLQRLRVEFPAAGIYLSGQVTVDAPEEVELVTKPNQLATVTIAGNTATLNHHPIEAAVIQLQGQFATGTLTAKVMLPRP